MEDGSVREVLESMGTRVWSPESSKESGGIVNCKINSEEVDAGGLWGFLTGQPSLLGEFQTHERCCREKQGGAVEVARWLKALDALLEDPGSVPATTRWLTALSNSSSRRANTLLGNLLALGMHVMCRHTYCRPNIYTQKKINPPLKENRVGSCWRRRPEVILWSLCTYEHGCSLIQPQTHVHRGGGGGLRISPFIWL